MINSETIDIKRQQIREDRQAFQHEGSGAHMRLFSRYNGTEFEIVATHVLKTNKDIFGLGEIETHHHIRSTNTWDIVEILDSHLKMITIPMEAGHI